MFGSLQMADNYYSLIGTITVSKFTIPSQSHTSYWEDVLSVVLISLSSAQAANSNLSLIHIVFMRVMVCISSSH